MAKKATKFIPLCISGQVEMKEVPADFGKRTAADAAKPKTKKSKKSKKAKSSGAAS
jgi:hypothetical protein